MNIELELKKLIKNVLNDLDLEEDIIIETGADRNKMKIQRWAVNTNVTKTEQHKKEVEKAREAAKEKKEAKKSDKKSDK